MNDRWVKQNVVDALELPPLSRRGGRLLLVMAFVGCSCLAIRVQATTGGPQLAEPAGWDPETGEVFFLLNYYDESGRAPMVVRLALEDSTYLFQPVPWSIAPLDLQSYEAELQTLRGKLKPLKEYPNTTIPSHQVVLSRDTLQIYIGAVERMRVEVRWFGGACEGKVLATVYRDPSIRLVRHYWIKERGVTLGVLSYVGDPFEGGYEVQVPLRLPRDRSVTVEIERPR